MPRKGRDSHADYEKYKRYYLDREASPQGEKKRVVRNRDRREAIQDGRLKGPHDPRTVDHIKPLAKGGSGARSNTDILSSTANRRKYDHTRG